MTPPCFLLTFDGMKKTKGETISGGLRSMMLMVFLQFLVGGVGAQGFSNLYYDNRPSMMFGSIVPHGQNYYFTGTTTTNSGPPYYGKACFGKIRSDGMVDSIFGIIDTNQFGYENFNNTLKLITDGNFISVGSEIDSVPRVYFIKTDTADNILLWQQYTEQGVDLYHAQDVVEIPDGGYLIAINAHFISSNSQVIIIRTDLAGNVINKRTYGLAANEFPWVIRPMLNGHYMIGGFSGKTNSNTPYWAKTWLLEVDSMGNYISQWLDTNTRNLWPRGMQQTADSGWIIVRQHLSYDINDFQKYNASIVKYDNHFGIEWEQHLGDSSDVTGFYDVEILPDGKYIACGTTPIWGSDSAHRFGWIVKFDTDGTVIWDRKYVSYERFGTHSFLDDIDVLPNGDLLACGELQFTFDVGITPLQQGWILRTDSNGCELSSCVTGISQSEIRHPKFAIFPNPASDQVFIESATTTQGELSIADELGRVLYTNPHFDGATAIKVNNWMNGIYFYRLRTSTNEQRSGKIVVQH